MEEKQPAQWLSSALECEVGERKDRWEIGGQTPGINIHFISPLHTTPANFILSSNLLCWLKAPEFSCLLTLQQSPGLLFINLLENMLKWRTDSDTNLTIVCRHRWSR